MEKKVVFVNRSHSIKWLHPKELAYHSDARAARESTGFHYPENGIFAEAPFLHEITGGHGRISANCSEGKALAESICHETKF